MDNHLVKIEVKDMKGKLMDLSLITTNGKIIFNETKFQLRPNLIEQIIDLVKDNSKQEIN